MAWSKRTTGYVNAVNNSPTRVVTGVSVTAGDLIVVFASGSTTAQCPSEIEDTASNSYTNKIGYAGAFFYAIANGSGSIDITVTFGSDTSWVYRSVQVAVFNPDGDTVSFVNNDITSNSWATSKQTGELSGTQNDVLAIAGFCKNNKTLDTILIDGAAPGETNTTTNAGENYWTIYTSGASGIDAYGSTTTSGFLELQLCLFELTGGGGGISIPVVMQQMDQFNGGSFL